MSDHLVKINMRVSGLAPWRCPICRAYSIHYKPERVVRWSLAKSVFCNNECGIAGKLISGAVVPDSGVYDLYAPKSLIPKLVARKLRGELDGPRSDIEELRRRAGIGPYVKRKMLTEFHEESILGGRLKFNASCIDVPLRLPPII